MLFHMVQKRGFHKTLSLTLMGLVFLLIAHPALSDEARNKEFTQPDDFFVLVKSMPIEPSDAFERKRPWGYGYHLFSDSKGYVIMGGLPNYVDTSTADKFRYRFNFETKKVDVLENDVELDKIFSPPKLVPLPKNSEGGSDNKLPRMLKLQHKKLEPIIVSERSQEINQFGTRCNPYGEQNQSGYTLVRAMTQPFLYAITNETCSAYKEGQGQGFYLDVLNPTIRIYEDITVVSDPAFATLFAFKTKKNKQHLCADFIVIEGKRLIYKARYYLLPPDEKLDISKQDNFQAASQLLGANMPCKQIKINVQKRISYRFVQ